MAQTCTEGPTDSSKRCKGRDRPAQCQSPCMGTFVMVTSHGRKVMAETGLGLPPGARLFPCEARTQAPPLAARCGPWTPLSVCPVRAGARRSHAAAHRAAEPTHALLGCAELPLPTPQTRSPGPATVCERQVRMGIRSEPQALLGGAGSALLLSGTLLVSEPLGILSHPAP